MRSAIGRFPLGNEVRLSTFSADPYPILKRLQEDEPVSWIPEFGQWFVTRRSDIEAVLLDPATFTVESRESLLDDTIGTTMLSADGPRQHRLRQPFQPAFNPRAVRDSMTEGVRSRAARLIGNFAAAGTTDIATSFSNPLALETVTEALGLYVHDVAVFRSWFTDIAGALGNFVHDPVVRARGQAAAAEFGAYAAPQLARMRATPDRSVLGSALHAPEGLSDGEIIAAARVIIFGGLETTSALISNTLWALLKHPAQFRAVCDDLALLKKAIEESLRWAPPVQSLTRRATRPVTICGVEIGCGDIVQCMVGAGNRDPDRFTDPDSFDIWRANSGDHLSFAIGKHYCLGAALARLEAEIGLLLLIERLPELRFDPDHPSDLRGHEFRSPPTLHVCWTINGGNS
jgi:hypothetical protein